MFGKKKYLCSQQLKINKMRNFFKEYVDIVSSIEILILLIMGGYWSYDKYNENTLKQKEKHWKRLKMNW